MPSVENILQITKSGLVAADEKSFNRRAKVNGKSADTLSVEKIIELTDFINDKIRQYKINLAFSIDERTKKVIIRLIDSETNEVIKEIPSQELRKIAENITKFIGLLVDGKS